MSQSMTEPNANPEIDPETEEQDDAVITTRLGLVGVDWYPTAIARGNHRLCSDSGPSRIPSAQGNSVGQGRCAITAGC